MDFRKIDTEESRTYVFAKDGELVEVTIKTPLELNVSESGGHRILDAEGISHYIPSGWVHLHWKVKEGQAPFSF